MKQLKVYTDGGARGNPGPAGAGIVFRDENGKPLHSMGKYLGELTNNQAEYQAVILALEEIKRRFYDTKSIEFFLDSQLVVEQLNKKFKVKNEGLAPYFIKIHNLTTEIGKKIKFNYIPREENITADELVNKAIDKELDKK